MANIIINNSTVDVFYATAYAAPTTSVTVSGLPVTVDVTGDYLEIRNTRTGTFATQAVVEDVILNAVDFEDKYDTLLTATNSLFRIYSANPGRWGNDIQVAIAKESDFGFGFEAFPGVPLDTLYEYRPSGDLTKILTGTCDEEFAIIFKLGDKIEPFTVSLNRTQKDKFGRSTFIENVVNRQSELVFLKVSPSVGFDDVKNVSFLYKTYSIMFDVTSELKKSNGQSYTPQIYSRILQRDGTPKDRKLPLLYGGSSSRVIAMSGGITTAVTQTDDLERLKDGYSLWDNVEQVDIDIVIGNELDNGASAIELAMDRKDCIAFVGASYDTCVKKRSVSTAIQEIVALRDNRISFDTSYAAMFGNYKYQYDRFNDVARWVNIAGDCAGLRAQTNVSHASWWASAGLERGQLRNVTKLAFIPNNDQRDTLYKNSVNPITEFPGLGNVVWGQKTLQRMASSFDRINVRCLFNTLERSMSKMSKYQVFEFNDDFTRNRILSMMNPFLESVKSGRGIADYRVICDRTNNTPDIISRNQMMIDILIKPNYVAEFITLRFFNLGVNDFESVVL